MNEPGIGKFISELVGRLLSLDPANLVIVGTIAFGYILHFTVKKFPKEHVPLATAVFTLVLYPLLAFKDGEPFRKLVMDVILAMVLWVIAWGIHKFVLMPLRLKLKKQAARDDDATEPESKKKDK